MLYKKHALIKIGNICNNCCVGCSVSSGDTKPFIEPTDKIKEELIKVKKAGFDSVELIGGEVTLQSNFFELLEFTASLFSEVILVTNGRLLKYETYVKKLIGCCPGLNIEIALHGHNSVIHDAFTRTPDSFIQAVEGIKNIIKYKKYFGTIGVNTLITKINYRYISNILKLLIDFKYINEWYLLIFAPVEGRALQNAGSLMIRYKELLDINRLLIQAYGYLSSIDLNEFPYCLIEQDILEAKKDKIHIINSDIIETDKDGIICNFNPTFSFNKIRYISNVSASPKLKKLRKIHSCRMKLDTCKKCRYSLLCGGVWQEYVECFGAANVNGELEYLKRRNFSKDCRIKVNT